MIDSAGMACRWGVTRYEEIAGSIMKLLAHFRAFLEDT